MDFLYYEKTVIYNCYKNNYSCRRKIDKYQFLETSYILTYSSKNN